MNMARCVALVYAKLALRGPDTTVLVLNVFTDRLALGRPFRREDMIRDPRQPLLDGPHGLIFGVPAA